MPSCMVLGCLTGSGREKDKYTTLVLPKSKEIREKWLDVINKSDYKCTSRSVVCFLT